ncbi:hypothetical protein B0H14DRAFT_2402475, partial [Mycena olivaceomarginata]
QILAWTGDNALSNDTQNTSLGDSPNNSFEAVNRIRCYNHTLNLAVQAFLRPFSSPKKKGGREGYGLPLRQGRRVPRCHGACGAGSLGSESRRGGVDFGERQQSRLRRRTAN